MTFRKRGTIEAMQITEEWFKEHTIQDLFIIPNGVTVDTEAKKVYIKGNPNADKDYTAEAKASDWIIYGGARTYMMHNDEFVKLYEPVEVLIEPPCGNGCEKPCNCPDLLIGVAKTEEDFQDEAEARMEAK